MADGILKIAHANKSSIPPENESSYSKYQLHCPHLNHYETAANGDDSHVCTCVYIQQTTHLNTEHSVYNQKTIPGSSEHLVSTIMVSSVHGPIRLRFYFLSEYLAIYSSQHEECIYNSMS